jgi:hypothetical protein
MEESVILLHFNQAFQNCISKNDDDAIENLSVTVSTREFC